MAVMTRASAKPRLDLAWMRYELRRVGSGLLIPLIVIAVFAGFGVLMRLNDVSPERSMRAVVAGLEIGVATAVGLTTASLIAGDSMIELQLSLPTPYRTTFVRRLGLLLLWSALIGIAATIVARLVGHALAPVSFIESQLVWFSPLIMFTGAAALLTLILNSRAASSAVIAGIWIMENLFGKRFAGHAWLRPIFLFATSYLPGASFWLSNRIELAAIGLMLCGLVFLWLGRNPATLLRGEE